ncbi:MAG TPA: hypothetical protein VIT85_02235 [Solirubrobacterales bacterium]
MKPRRSILLLASTLLLGLLAGCGGDSDTGTSGGSFEPTATLRAVGGSARTDKPDFVLRVQARPGDENLRSVNILLPPVTLVDATSIGRICGRAELESDRCVDRKPLGFARVDSPAYDAPLEGDVFAVSGPESRLPKLVFVLGGPVDVLLEGRIVSEGGRIGAGVDDIPDTRLRSFDFTIDGGKSGYLILNRNICAGEPEADATFESQGGQVVRTKLPLEADC